MRHACDCGATVPLERVELGYTHCIRCASAQPKLARPSGVVTIGQHKGPDLVMALHDPIIMRGDNTYDRGSGITNAIPATAPKGRRQSPTPIAGIWGEVLIQPMLTLDTSFYGKKRLMQVDISCPCGWSDRVTRGVNEHEIKSNAKRRAHQHNMTKHANTIRMRAIR